MTDRLASTGWDRRRSSGAALERDTFWLNQHRALSFCLGKIFRKNPVSTFPDRANRKLIVQPEGIQGSQRETLGSRGE
jgi:hypothetical protein